MTLRIEDGVTYEQDFDAENRLVFLTVNNQTTHFIYDGDGNLVVKYNPDNTSTIYIGSVYEVHRNSWGGPAGTTTYYPAAGAMRVNGVLYYVLKDKLGSSSVVLNDSGGIVGETRYYPFGETREVNGSMLTDRLFTGQREMAGLGLYHYGARFYSSTLGRFIQTDTIYPNPGNPKSLNRFSYVYNNPINYSDPSGHDVGCAGRDASACGAKSSSPSVTKTSTPSYPYERYTPSLPKPSTPVTPKTPTPPSTPRTDDEDEDRTVSQKAFTGDLSSIIELLIPTHLGGRIQVELSSIPVIGASGTLGVNAVYNFKSDKLAANVDWALEPSLGAGAGASLTGGVLLGWLSSDVDEVTKGNSGILSATAAVGGVALAAGLTAPINENGLIVDPYYGQVPFTLYGGAGVGAEYVGVGGGLTGPTDFYWDLTEYLPWHTNK